LELTTGESVGVPNTDSERLRETALALRAEGSMTGLQPNGWTLNGMQRYDVLMQNMVMVPYQAFSYSADAQRTAL
jgi:hypothetical protein